MAQASYLWLNNLPVDLLRLEIWNAKEDEAGIVSKYFPIKHNYLHEKNVYLQEFPCFFFLGIYSPEQFHMQKQKAEEL